MVIIMIKQISVFVENKKGRVYELLKAIAEKNVNMKALSLADTSDFGIVRLVVDDYDNAEAAIKGEGVVMKIGNVIAVAVYDEPGALVNTFSVLADNDIVLEYMYAAAEKFEGKSVIILRCDKPELAEEKLKLNGIKVISQKDMEKL